jgi:hypothetical protein
MKTRLRFFLLVVLPLVAGGLIYVFCRPGTIRFKTWFAQTPVTTLQHVLPDWMVYNLPAGLWLFAFLYLLHLLQSQWYYFASAICFAFGAELLQATAYAGGTFDAGDLLAYSVAGAVFFLLQKINPVKPIPA